MPHIIVGTAGHIDHGKTALVKALTGIDADRLKEEKERGITIDIGFANLVLDADTTIGFIDVPGHERFIKNMLAGVGGIDMVMLVIAADESVMPQTREHLDICSLLHIKHGLTVLTKIDNVERDIADLAEIEVRDIERGMVLTVPGVFKPTSMFDCHLELLLSAPNAIETRKRIRFHIGTAELMGYAVLLGQERLEPGESAFAQIRLERPTFALPDDRFIIRQYSPMITIGGGEILDAMPLKHRRTDRTIVEKLRVFKEGAIDDRLMAVVEEAGLQTTELLQVVARLGLAPDLARERCTGLAKTGRIRLLGENPFVAVSAGALKNAADSTAKTIREFHQANPLVQGIGREELKARVFSDASNLFFQAVLDKLASEKTIALSQDIIYEFGRKVTLKADEERMRVQLADRFRSLGLQAPAPDEMIDSLKLDRNTARKIIQLMVKENVLIKITEDMFVERAAVEKLVSDIKTLKSKKPKLGVSEFKDLAGVSRKYAIPLLEYLDRQRVTRRVGDERWIL